MIEVRIPGYQPADLLTARAAAAILGSTIESLVVLRCVGRGPESVKLDGQVRYRVSSIIAWIESKPWSRPAMQRQSSRTPTSPAKPAKP